MLHDVIQRARRRLLLNDALRRLVASAAVDLFVVISLLVVGTRFLDWWVVGAVAAAGLAYVATSVRRHAASPYGAAVELDRRAGLQDSLSTALHFSGESFSGGHVAAFVNTQRAFAEERAHSVHVPSVIPLKWPRHIYTAAGLAVIAIGLAAARYGVLHSLDLRAPITEVLFEDLAAPKGARDRAALEGEAQRKKRLEDAQSLLAKLGVPINVDNPNPPDALDKAIEDALQPPIDGKAAKAQKGDGPANGANGLEQAPAGDPIDGKPDEKDEAGKSADAKDSAGNDGGRNAKTNSGENSSLLSKLKDAVSNLLSNGSQDPGQKQKAQGRQQQAQNGKGERGKGEKSGGKGQESNEPSDGQDGDPNTDNPEGQQAQSKASSKGAQQSAQAGSGMGSQDGAKELRAAEQLKAMGKISEIIGKRSSAVTGETMVEVQSGNQQLRTAYSKKAAGHGETQSDVSRDEIPVSLQPFVREYFERVRKSSGPAPKTAVQ